WFGEREADRAAVEAALGATHLTALADRRVGELSGGERQRVALALALAQEPELLLLDEATANLDLRHQVGMLSLVQGLIADRGLTVLATLHDPNLAGRFFQQLFVLHGGRIVAAGSPGEILRPEVLEPVFQIPLVSLPHPESGAPLLFWRGEDASRPPDAGRAAAQG
ncbi:MAG: ABC transporter ATP-binding protein, partial [Armatimonadetes bacterium]|nr:ABC transporter ATP-binding protein [Armatimonadota bacterium]